MIFPSKVFKHAFFVAIILFGAITATEVSFRVGGYQGNQFRSILFGDDLNSPLLFEESPSLWWKLRKNVMVTFLGKKVATDNFGLRVSTHADTRESENDW